MSVTNPSYRIDFKSQLILVRGVPNSEARMETLEGSGYVLEYPNSDFLVLSIGAQVLMVNKSMLSSIIFDREVTSAS